MPHHFTALRRAATAAAIALVLTVTLASVPGASAAPRAQGSPLQRVSAAVQQTGATPETVAARRRERFTPKPGIITTDPRHADHRKLLRHIIKAINSTPRRKKIRIISWNVTSRGFVDRLIAAHRRGVSVRLLMSEGKREGNNQFWRLKRELKQGRPKINLSKRHRSWARTCERSCRGNRGIAHSKLFMFSRVGEARRVIMSTSANATENAANVQWNDLYTQIGNRSIWRGFNKVFRESRKDQPIKNAYRTFGGKTVTGYVYPWKGKHARGDRVMNELRRITCKGAQGRTGINGRTRIRIAQDAILDDRGVDIAKILRTKWENGCDIRIVYALMGRRVLGVLRHTSRGPVPIRQIVQDWEQDGIYDRYLHSKSMAVSGWYRKDRSARVAWQGSENWSGLAKLSDEQGFQIRRNGAEGTYARWVDYLYNNPPPASSTARTMRLAQERCVDPYALIREELGLPERDPC